MVFRSPEPPVLVKKYGNRRLYDTRESRYIKLAELEQLVRDGSDVRVVDAKTDEDLTQATLVQIILDRKDAARLLPAPLLTQMVRLGDDGLAEIFSEYIGMALEWYLEARRGAQRLGPYGSLATLPMDAAGQLLRMLRGGSERWSWSAPSPEAPSPPPPNAAPQELPDEIAALRRDM